MIVYEANIDDDGQQRIFTTLKEAVAAAKLALKNGYYMDEVTIERCKTVPVTKEFIVDLLNNAGGWCANAELVKVVRRKGAKS